MIVENIDPKVTEEHLKMFFLNRRRSGGGDIDSIHTDKDTGRAVIIFKDAEGGYWLF